jgi:hypothetical protein
MYTEYKIIGNTNTATLTVTNATLYIAVTALDADGIESDPSNEVISPAK